MENRKRLVAIIVSVFLVALIGVVMLYQQYIDVLSELGQVKNTIDEFNFTLQQYRILTRAFSRLSEIEKVYKLGYSPIYNYTGNIDDYTVNQTYTDEEFIQYYFTGDLKYEEMRYYVVQFKNRSELVWHFNDIRSYCAGFKDHDDAYVFIAKRTIGENYSELLDKLYNAGQAGSVNELIQETSARFLWMLDEESGYKMMKDIRGSIKLTLFPEN
jgi:hypothetical protein